MKKIVIIVIFLAIIVGAYFYFQSRSKGGGTFWEWEPLKFTPESRISAVIIPHFDTFADKRAELLKGVAGKVWPRKIILVSVNHFNAGGNDIITADKNWQLSAGKVYSDQELVKKLVDSGKAAENLAAFDNEHGINNIIPDLRANFPDVSILPIIIKDKASREKIDDLSAWITENCPECLLVASVDFSHYCPRALAHVHDNFSIQALSNLDQDKIWQAETDSPQTLYLAAKLAESEQAKNFHLYYNSNSGDASGNDDAEVTSVVLGYYGSAESENPPAAGEPSSTFVIAGDAMFDRNVWHNYKGIGLKKIFANFGTRPFRGADLSLLNLEGPISASEIDDDWKSGSMVFNFPPETSSVLKYLNVGAVSLANNHSANAGASGLANTKKVLGDAGIKYFGQAEGFDKVASTVRLDGPIPLSVIGVMALSDFDETALEAKIKTEKSAGRAVIIFPHWGEEYKESHVASQESLAEKWIAAGADLTVGSHPHVTEDFEIIDGKPIIYSLGNFVFDQFFSTETQEGLVIAGTISKDKITLSFLPTREKVVKPEFMTGAAKTAKIKTFLDINSESGFKKISSDTIEIPR